MLQAIKEHVRAGIAVHELDCNINDPPFADAAVRLLLELMKTRSPAQTTKD